jgi:hypothetical protein
LRKGGAELEAEDTALDVEIVSEGYVQVKHILRDNGCTADYEYRSPQTTSYIHYVQQYKSQRTTTEQLMIYKKQSGKNCTCTCTEGVRTQKKKSKIQSMPYRASSTMMFRDHWPSPGLGWCISVRLPHPSVQNKVHCKDNCIVQRFTSHRHLEFQVTCQFLLSNDSAASKQRELCET